jgi:hypothetical protein
MSRLIHGSIGATMHKSHACRWMLGAFLPSLLLAAGALAALGTDAPGTILGLKLTARWAYAFFWPAYAGGALRLVLGPRLQPVARRGRELGFAFAAAMLPHIALVVWIFHISPTPPMSRAKEAYFIVALVFTYLLALLSIRRFSVKWAAAANRVIRIVGVEYIALAFLRDFLAVPPHSTLLQWFAYLPFIALAVAAGLLRLRQWSIRIQARWHANHDNTAPRTANR